MSNPSLADALDPNAAWNRRFPPHTCSWQAWIRELRSPETCAGCHADADREAARLPPVPAPAWQPMETEMLAVTLQRLYNLTTWLLSEAPSGVLSDGAAPGYHHALRAVTALRDELRRDKLVEHDEGFWHLGQKKAVPTHCHRCQHLATAHSGRPDGENDACTACDCPRLHTLITVNAQAEPTHWQPLPPPPEEEPQG